VLRQDSIVRQGSRPEGRAQGFWRGRGAHLRARGRSKQRPYTGRPTAAGLAACAAVLLGLVACAPAAPLASAPTGAAPSQGAPSGAAPSQAAPAAKGTLRLAISGKESNTYSVIYIAEQAGYYREQGLDLEIKEANPGVATQALVGGQFDVAHAASPGIAAAIKGGPVKLVYALAEPSPYWIIARKDLKTWADLKGKTIGAYSTTGTQVLDISRVLGMNGVSAQADGVKYVAPGGVGDDQMLGSLRAGSIDAAAFAGTGAVVALDEGFTLLGDMHGIKTYDFTFWANNQALSGKPDLIRAFVTGMLKGTKIYKNDAARAIEYTTAQFGGNRHWAERMRELSAPWYSDDGLPSEAGWREAIRYKEEGAGEASTVAPDQMLALDFTRQANDELTRSGWKP
jgi:ABC-type nitrate/sulfonate/bicarbonate transport system substrate-binding protein